MLSMCLVMINLLCMSLLCNNVYKITSFFVLNIATGMSCVMSSVSHCEGGTLVQSGGVVWTIMSWPRGGPCNNHKAHCTISVLIHSTLCP